MTRKPAKSEIQNFEVSLEKLKTIVSQLENGKLTLSESLERYEEGIKSLKECHEALNVAQMKIEQLVRLDENGRLITKPYDDTASFDNLSAKSASPSDSDKRCATEEKTVKPREKRSSQSSASDQFLNFDDDE